MLVAPCRPARRREEFGDEFVQAWVGAATRSRAEVLKSVALRGEVAFVGYRLSSSEGARPIDPAILFTAGAVLRPVATGSRAHFVELNRAVATHRLRPVIDRVFSFDRVPEAFAYCESGGGFGKVIISHD